MAAPDTNYDVHDNKAFTLAEDDSKDDDINIKLNSDTTESLFQVADHDEKAKAAANNTQGELRTIITICTFFGVSVAIALILTIYLGPPQVIPHGAISSRTASCSEIGGLVLKAGGSAADSIVAVVLCESITEQSIILGCGILVYHDQRKNSSFSLDFSCSNAQGQMNNDEGIYPTLLKGLATVHERLGLLKWKDDLQLVIDNFHIKEQPDSLSTKMMELLKQLSLKGVDYSFSELLIHANWTGITATQIENLRSYKPNFANPQQLVFRDYSFETTHTPTSLSMFMMISIMENITMSGKIKWNSTEFYHYFVEAAKLVETNQENITSLKASSKEWTDLSKYLASMISDDKVLQMEVPKKQRGIKSLKINIIGPNDDLISAVIWHDNTSKVEPPQDFNHEAAIALIIHNLIKPCAVRLATTSSNHLGLAQVLIKYFGGSTNISNAMLEPKLYPIGDTLFYEENFQDDVIKMLGKKGHAKIAPLVNLTSKNGNIDIIWKDGEAVNCFTDETSDSIHIF